jgi:hypothetical protein
MHQVPTAVLFMHQGPTAVRFYALSTHSCAFYALSTHSCAFYALSTHSCAFYAPSTHSCAFYAPSTHSCAFYAPSTHTYAFLQRHSFSTKFYDNWWKKCKVFPVHVIKVYKASRGKAALFLTSELDRDECQLHDTPGTHWIWGFLGPRDGLGHLEKRKTFNPAGIRTAHFPNRSTNY